MLALSQADIAQALGTSVEQIREYEDGAQQISTDYIDQLSAVLKCRTASSEQKLIRRERQKISALCRFQTT